MSRTATLALLAALAAGCARNDKPVPGVQFGGTQQAREDPRVKELLAAVDARLAEQEGVLRRAREAGLPPEKRLDALEAWDTEAERIQKQIDEIIALSQARVREGTLPRDQALQVKTTTERFDRLSQEWQALLDGIRPELLKGRKAEPPKK